MTADVPDRATGAAKSVRGAIGSTLTENRLDRSGAGSGSNPVIEGNGSAAVGRGSGWTAGRDDERFMETTDPSGLALAGGAGSTVAGNSNQCLSFVL